MGLFKHRVWDRSKQTYFILRRGTPWKVMDMKGERTVADYPAFLYNGLLEERVCFAASDEAVVEIMKKHAEGKFP
jgi:hypothetical protein